MGIDATNTVAIAVFLPQFTLNKTALKRTLCVNDQLVSYVQNMQVVEVGTKPSITFCRLATKLDAGLNIDEPVVSIPKHHPCQLGDQSAPSSCPDSAETASNCNLAAVNAAQWRPLSGTPIS
mmetsp:Transcript_8538/g.18751  ORF Transcript_8538/g.18751 Transcript_8538/m.18751 type:complete len:122 (-) Transcript_8538:972-1337(-)